MTTDTDALAERLLEAQVAHQLEALRGAAGERLVVAELHQLLADLDDVPVRALVDPGDAVDTLATLIEVTGASSVVDEGVPRVVALLHGLEASQHVELGALVPREHVERVVATAAGSAELRSEVLRRTGASPALATIAMRFVQSLVGDAVQQNRERAERLPGVRSALKVGDFAARQARNLAPDQLEEALGGAADKGAQAAMERVNRALADAVDEELLRAAVLELWDLHADQAVSGLRAYLTEEQAASIAYHVHEAARGAVTAPWFHAVLTAVVSSFLDEWGDATVGDLRRALELDDVVLEGIVARHAPTVLAALDEGGQLEAFVRRRLGHFWRTEQARALLADVG